jgi:acetyl esterase/lipase
MHTSLDPELGTAWGQVLLSTGGQPLSLDDIPAARQALLEYYLALNAKLPAINGVLIKNLQVGCNAVPVRIYKPRNQCQILPALLWIHGGGYVAGNLEMDDRAMQQIVRDLHCIVVSVDYRLAPEHPYPIPLEDCYCALQWLVSDAQTIGVDPGRIALGGASAGGGLATCLAILARDRNLVTPCLQLLLYPMLDNRPIDESKWANNPCITFTPKANNIAWRSYLGPRQTQSDVPPCAVASRTPDLKGLAPAFILACDLDILVEENLLYGVNLMSNGVATEIHQFPGTFHGFDSYVETKISQRFIRVRNEALMAAFSA